LVIWSTINTNSVDFGGPALYYIIVISGQWENVRNPGKMEKLFPILEKYEIMWFNFFKFSLTKSLLPVGIDRPFIRNTDVIHRPAYPHARPGTGGS